MTAFVLLFPNVHYFPHLCIKSKHNYTKQYQKIKAFGKYTNESSTLPLYEKISTLEGLISMVKNVSGANNLKSSQNPLCHQLVI